MKFSILTLITGMILISCNSPKNISTDVATNTPIKTTIDLSQIVEDRVPVVIDPGRFVSTTVTYSLPKVVQGTYSVSDFGSFVDNFKALDYEGNELQVTKTSTNSWQITNATQLDKIIYLVNDTFDIESKEGQETPFSPAGTNISPENYVLNLHGFIGYFDSLKNNQYSLDVTGPTALVRTSALHQVGTSKNEDGSLTTTSYFAPRYFDITDNPMMYGDLDVEEFQVGDIKIVLSVYSPNKKHSATSLKEAMFTMMKAQKEYLGDINSTPRYDIYVYLSEGTATSPGGNGALEHHTSTVVVMPESMPAEALANSLVDIVSHEFFHIVTPLSVHSEDVHYFDYNTPTFSKHLWMYEGVTEYFATLFQVDQGLVTEDEFYTTIMEKIATAAGMDDSMSFTEMSENVLDQPYARNFYNVYQKGALIGMCIDIILREESNGQRGILSLMKELSLKYGKNKPFNDDSLFEEITAMTYPSIGQFFKNHVVGGTPINYNAFFDKAGLMVIESEIKTNYVMNGGSVIFSANQAEAYIHFNQLVSDNSFWAENGVLPNDIVRTIDGVDITMQNANQMFQKVYSWQPGKDIKVKLERNGKEILIDTTLTQSYTTGKSLKSKENVPDEQLKLRNAWLRG